MNKSIPPERADRRRLLLLLAALVLLLGANLRPCYRVTVAGEALPGRYSPQQLRDCAQLARDAAEEILPGSPEEPEMETRLLLSLRPADGDEVLLGDALLRATGGIAVAERVEVNGVRLGTVADGERLLLALERSIRGQMPLRAVTANLGGRLELQQVYTRSGCDTPDADMVLLITGMAPVVYVDADGKLA